MIADVVAGEVVTITSHGRPVAQIAPLAKDTVRGLIDAGRARPAKHRLSDLRADTGATAWYASAHGSSLLDLIHLEEALSELLGVSVDVVSIGALLERDDEIRRDAVPL